MKRRTTLAAAIAFGVLLAGVASMAKADSMDSANDIESLVSYVEKGQKGEDGRTPLDKDQLKKVQKQLREKIVKARKANAAELASWTADSNNPPQKLSRELMQLWKDGMNKRKQRIDDASGKLDVLEDRISALSDIKPKKK